jgi:hypothetical protein
VYFSHFYLRVDVAESASPSTLCGVMGQSISRHQP